MSPFDIPGDPESFDVDCPACDGAGWFFGRLRRSSGLRPSVCWACAGTGRVTDERAQSMLEGVGAAREGS